MLRWEAHLDQLVQDAQEITVLGAVWQHLHLQAAGPACLPGLGAVGSKLPQESSWEGEDS